MYKRLAHYYLKQHTQTDRFRLFLTCLFLVLAKGALLLAPFYFAQIIEKLSPGNLGTPARIVVLLIFAYGLSRLMGAIAEELRLYCFFPFVFKIQRTIVQDVISHLYQLPYAFHVEQAAGSVSKTVSQGVRSLDLFVHMLMFNTIPMGLEIIVTLLAIVFFLPWYCVACFVVLTILQIALTSICGNKIHKSYEQAYAAENQIYTFLEEGLVNIEQVKYAHTEEYELEQLKKKIAEVQTHSLATANQTSVLITAQQAIISVGAVIFFVLIYLSVAYGKMNTTQAIMFMTYWLQLTSPIEQCAFSYSKLLTLAHDIDVFFDLLKVPAKPKQIQPNGLVLTSGSIECCNLSYEYKQSKFTLSNITFAIEDNTTLAIVGPNGAGKTTLIRLLLGMLEPTQGIIKIAGQDIAQVDRALLYASIAVVPQEVLLFNNTIAYNICYGSSTIDQAWLGYVLHQAQLTDFIARLPDGLDTIVGQRGIKISGGERQKIAIARALMKKPKILVWDEATASLDTHSDAELQKILLSIPCTKIIIAHRLAAVKHADKVIVMDEGRIEERGTHTILLNNGQLYKKLWDAL